MLKYKLSSDLNRQPQRPGDLDILTLKVVFESRVTWAISVPSLVFLGLSVLDLVPMYATDRQTSDSIIALAPCVPPETEADPVQRLFCQLNLAFAGLLVTFRYFSFVQFTVTASP